VTEPPKKTPGLEVESQSLQDELIAIKDRLSAIETIASISNATVVKKYVEDHLLTDKGIAIMKECEGDPRTRNYLKTTLDFKSDQALDYHLKPLREADLLRPRVESGAIVFEWSNLFGRLPKSTIRAILGKPK
jgi:DNA-binding transcriptional ArsR family regulator